MSNAIPNTEACFFPKEGWFEYLPSAAESESLRKAHIKKCATNAAPTPGTDGNTSSANPVKVQTMTPENAEIIITME